MRFSPARLPLAILLAGSLVAASVLLSPLIGRNPAFVYAGSAVIASSTGKPIELRENPAATDPTFAGLMAFVASDQTDTQGYIETESAEGYMCAEFARDLHNHAEAAGIRAAFVALTFTGKDEGHALDAFMTTDRGLVYIDCTGGRMYADMPDSVTERNSMFLQTQTHDTVAYIEEGQPYGRIPVNLAAGLDYAFYVQHTQEWDAYVGALEKYNADVTQYNLDWADGKFRSGTPLWTTIKAREATLSAENRELERLEGELGGFPFESLGVVEKVFIRW
jgi:hypothetical protein